MEHWGIEVKAGETSKVQPGDGMIVHLSQASLGEIKKDMGKESVKVFVSVDGKKLILCTLSLKKLPQQPFDLVFERDFELSHNLKSGSVSFFGYKTRNYFSDDDDMSDRETDSDSSDDEIPVTVVNNGKPEVKAKEEKATDAKKSDEDKVSAPKKEKTAIIKSEDNDSDDSTSDDDVDTDSDEDDDSSDDSSSEEETPAKVEPEKKVEPVKKTKVEPEKKVEPVKKTKAEPEKKRRSSDSEPETPAANKKVKLATPQKTDGKSGGTSHVATPHPSKQTEKKPAASSSQKAPKSAGGSHACKSCSRTFGSETGLEAHTKAKHSAGK